MARILLSPLAADLRGKLGGFIAQRGPGGLSLRAPSTSSRVPSARQRDASAVLARASATWRTLDTPSRALWGAIAREYSPSAVGPGLASSLARASFVRWLSGFLLTGGTPTRLTPLVYPFSPVSAAGLVLGDPTPADAFLLVDVPVTPVRAALWLQHAPNFPQYAGRGPWRLVYTSAEDPGLTWTKPSVYRAALPLDRFLPLAGFGLTSFWRLRLTLTLIDESVARSDLGPAVLQWA